MTLEEKSLYHQIYPLKLFTDWSTGIIMLYLLWIHSLVLALCIGVIPSVIVSLLFIKFIPLEKYKQSAFGKYVAKYMTKAMEVIRIVGFIIAAIAAWYHIGWLILLGILIVLFGWLKGKLSH